MSVKTVIKEIENLFKKSSGSYVIYENIIELFDKQPTLANAKKMNEFAKKYKLDIISSSERAKRRNIADAAKLQEERERRLGNDNSEDEFDFMKERELLEWSRSDSPVRMYLREMGQIELLTKDEEIEISKKIELGEDTILNAICSVPYLIDFILDYKEPLINRERRVKELFKSFEDDNVEENENETDVDNLETAEKKTPPKDTKRITKVIDSFKGLDKAKKEWMKIFDKGIDEKSDNNEKLYHNLILAFKKKLLKESLLDLGPTSKLINELTKAMETALKSDVGFEKELKRLEYKLPLFNDTLIANHKEVLDKIMTMTKNDIINSVPEATMVSTYVEIKKLFRTKEASKDGFNLEPEELKAILEQIKRGKK